MDAKEDKKLHGRGCKPHDKPGDILMTVWRRGKRTLDIESRNEAIELMKLKSYLRMDNQRPKWAYVADKIIAKNAPQDQQATDESSKSNILMQT